MNCWLVQRHVEVVADDGFKKREYVPNYPEDSPRQLIFFSLAGFAVKDGGKSIIKTCRCVSLAKLWFVQPSQSVTVAFAQVIYARFVLNVRSTQWAALPALVGNYQKNIHRLFPTDRYVCSSTLRHPKKNTHLGHRFSYWSKNSCDCKWVSTFSSVTSVYCRKPCKKNSSGTGAFDSLASLSTAYQDDFANLPMRF